MATVTKLLSIFLKSNTEWISVCAVLKGDFRNMDLREETLSVNKEMIRNLIRVEMANAGEQSGYRTIWHALRLIHHVHPPRELVSQILHKLDPDASHRGGSRIFYTLAKHIVSASLGRSGGTPSGKCLKFGSLKWHFPHSDSTLEQN